MRRSQWIFDDSYVTDRQSELESKRADALSFREIPALTIWYLMDRYQLSEKEATNITGRGRLIRTQIMKRRTRAWH